MLGQNRALAFIVRYCGTDCSCFPTIEQRLHDQNMFRAYILTNLPQAITGLNVGTDRVRESRLLINKPVKT